MRNPASYLVLLGVLPLLACDPPPTLDIDAAGTDAPGTDAGMADVGPTPDVPRVDAGASCGTVGNVGGSCRAPGNMCAGGLICQAEFVPAMGASTLRSVFDIVPAIPDTANEGFYVPEDPVDAANDIPFHAFTNSLCTSICDTGLERMETATSGELDTCGPCAACTTQLGMLGIAPSYIFLAAAMRTFGTNGTDTGFCRANCTFNPATNGGCPTGYTCDPGNLVCVEACTSDNECQLEFVNNRAGELLTSLNPANGTCNATTGRCDRGTGDDGVGRACEGTADCSTDVGLCLRGGTCGEYNCGFASDSTMDGLCDAGRGICLGNGPDNGTLCIQGCSTAAECNPGSACLPLTNGSGAPVSIGPMNWSGICLGICDIVPSDDDGPGPRTTADDQLINCRAEERCDMPNPTAADLDPDGVCRPTCTMDSECTGTGHVAGERCDMVPDTTYGFCHIPDQLCTLTGLDDDCYLGQRCDLLAFEGNLGLCVDGCVDNTTCDAGDECQVARGVCRTPCSASAPCDAGETCIASVCEQLTTM